MGGGPFVPGESTTRDKRTFCPGSWLHPGQKGPPIYVAQPPPFSNTWVFSDLRCATVVSHPRLLLRRCPRAPPELRRLHTPAASNDDPARPLTGAPPSPAPCHLVFAAPASTPRAPSSSPPPAASTARRRAATLSAACHRAASSPPRRPGPPPLGFPALCE